MARILLMGRFNQESFKLKDLLGRHLKFTLDWVRTPQQAVHALSSGTVYQLIIINTELYAHRKLQMVGNLRAIGCEAPVVFLADKIQADSRGPIPAFRRAIVLEKPISAADINGIILRAVRQGEVITRYHKRHSTYENARVEILRNGHRNQVLIRNLSLGGAYIEMPELLQMGEVLRVWVHLPAVGKTHELHAKVVWNSNKPQDDQKIPRGVGVQFIRNGEVYSELAPIV